MRVILTDTSYNVLTVTVDGEDFIFDKDTVQVGNNPDTRLDTLVLTGVTKEGARSLVFLHSDVDTPSGLTKEQVKSTIGAWCNRSEPRQGTDIVEYEPEDAGTVEPATSQYSELLVVINPLTNLDDLNIVLPSGANGQKVSLLFLKNVDTVLLSAATSGFIYPTDEINPAQGNKSTYTVYGGNYHKTN